MEFETRVSKGQVDVRHIEGHKYIFKIGEDDLVSDTTYKPEPFVSHGAAYFLTGAWKAAQKAYADSRTSHRP